MWLVLLRNVNQQCPIPKFKRVSQDELQLFTDTSASHDLGFGMIFGSEWVAQKWPDQFINSNPLIALPELFLIVASIILCGDHLSNQEIMLFSDNMACVAMTATLSSKCQYCQSLLRILVTSCMCHNIDLEVHHVQGHFNARVDALSHLQMTKFCQLAPDAKVNSEILPPSIWPVLRELLLTLNAEDFLNPTNDSSKWQY